MIPLSIAFSNELSFPHDEVITISFLLMSGMFFCFVITLVTLPLVLISPQTGMWFLTLMLLIALGFAVMLEEDLRRTKNELTLSEDRKRVSQFSNSAFSVNYSLEED